MIPRAGELVGLRRAQEAHMPDTCKILAHTLTDDAFNDPRPSYTPGEPTACGLKLTGGREVHEQGQIVISDGEIRLPSGTALANRDQVSVTHLKGEALASPLTFDVIGLPTVGPSGLVASLRRISHG